MSSIPPLHQIQTPGLFVTGTDTGVGKTVACCLIADQWLRRQTGAPSPSRVGVFKPIVTGCRKEREGLVANDTEQLAHAANFDPDIGDLDFISPIRFRDALSPAAALELDPSHRGIQWDLVDRSLRRLDDRCDRIVIEGLGGILAPIMQENRQSRAVTVLDFARAIGCPVVVVCRAGLGTLNHTAMTCAVIRQAGLSLAGLIINGYEPDSPDRSMQSNRDWLARQNHTRILATLPGRSTMDGVLPRPGSPDFSALAIPGELQDAIDATSFDSIARPARQPATRTDS